MNQYHPHPAHPAYAPIGYAHPGVVTQGVPMQQAYVLPPVAFPAAPAGRRVWPWVLGIISAAIVGLVAVLIVIGKGSLGTPVKVTENETVYYAGQATEADAKTIGASLQKLGYFNNSSKKDVTIRTDESGTQVRFVVKDGWDKPEVNFAFTVIGHTMSKSLGKPIKVKLVDAHLKELKEISL